MKPASAQDIRRRELAQIHIAVQELGMTDDDHRSLLWSVCQVKSAADLDWTGRKRYLDHLKKLGFKPRSKTAKPGQQRVRGPGKAQPSRQLAQDAESRKIRALWLLLHQLGAVRNPSEESLAAYVKRITKVDALQWISGEQAETLIETLKKWAMRYLPDQVKDMAQRLASAINAGGIQLTEEELHKLRHLVGLAQTRQTFDPMQDAWEALKKTTESGGTS